jgi:thiol-disulfide isomerase/thioredoxin/uncharacterized membrane protein YphA (DoxX/SURF4 family)
MASFYDTVCRVNAVVFVIRILLGLLLIVTGALKVGHPAELASAIAGFQLLPPAIIGPLAFGIPYIEVLLGACLVLGLFVRTVAIVSAVQFAVYAAAIASAVLRHIPANCGCFGPNDVVVADWPHVGLDIVLMLASAFVAWRAPVKTVSRPVTYATIALFAIACLAAIGYGVHPPREVQTASQSPVVGKAQVGQPAPQFSVATTNGLFDLSKADKPVLLEVFATWCPHCQRETAVVDKLYKTYGSRIDFVGVSGSETAMDGTSESSPLDVLNFAQRFNVQYPIAYDPNVSDPNDSKSVANLYLQGGFPTFAVIGKDKTVTYLNSGEIAYPDLAMALEKALRS